MVVATDLHKWFGKVHAVRGVSFALRQGEVVGLLGHNGAGKSTTIRMLTGYSAPDLGSVSIAGVDVTEDRVRATARLGYLPEATPLYPEMSVQDYIAFRAQLSGVRGSEVAGRVREVMERCWLTDMQWRRVGQLSKGYKQRVGLAAALVHDPAVLILDEPTSGLDPSQVRETRTLIRGLSRQRTVLISSHILPEVEQLCNRVLIFAGGQLRADGTLESLLRRAGGGYIVETRAPDDVQRAALLAGWRGLAGFEQVRAGTIDDWERAPMASGAEAGAWVQWKLDFSPDCPDPREAIALAAQRAGVALRELRTQASTLEQVFLQAQEGAPTGDDARARGGSAS